MTNDYSHLEKPRPDPIFTIALAARNAGPNAIDATAGVYMSEEGIPLIFESTKQALKLYGESLHNQDISYPPLLGLPQFRATVLDLIFGKDHENMVATIATTGGTGALAINLQLLKYMHRDIQVILPTPAWANHHPLCSAAGVTTIEAPYIENGEASINGVVKAMQQSNGPLALLVQAGCHNPIGLDLNDSQWDDLIAACLEHNCIVLLDMAYQGFADEPEQDSAIARKLAASGVTLLVTWSASKNHSIYGLRTGLAAAVVPDEETKETVEGHYSMISRGMHSSAPTAGQWIVQLVQENEHDQWLLDLRELRMMLNKKRDKLREALPDSFASSLNGHGMFAILPLTVKQIHTLRDEHAVFLLDSGRINIAGIPLRRLDEFAEKILQVHE